MHIVDRPFEKGHHVLTFKLLCRMSDLLPGRSHLQKLYTCSSQCMAAQAAALPLVQFSEQQPLARLALQPVHPSCSSLPLLGSSHLFFTQDA